MFPDSAGALSSQRFACGSPAFRPRCFKARQWSLRVRRSSSLSVVHKFKAIVTGPSDEEQPTPQSVACNAAHTTQSASELIQSVRNTLDLFSSFDDTIESDDWTDTDAEAFVPEHGTAAAAVGRAVYEVLRIDASGKQRRLYVKRRDLLRAHSLAPRDLRRIDPSVSATTNALTMYVKGNAVLVNMCGVRLMVMADKALLFEPNAMPAKRFLQIAIPRLQASAGARLMESFNARDAGKREQPEALPFELEIVEAVLMLVTSKLDAELVSATKRVQAVLQKLPANINPINLEELRRVKQALVDLEGRADSFKNMLEELMDDEDEIRDMNLSSRPIREERRKQRERERLEREVEREREQREWENRVIEYERMQQQQQQQQQRQEHDQSLIQVFENNNGTVQYTFPSANGVKHAVKNGTTPLQPPQLEPPLQPMPPPPPPPRFQGPSSPWPRIVHSTTSSSVEANSTYALPYLPNGAREVSTLRHRERESWRTSLDETDYDTGEVVAAAEQLENMMDEEQEERELEEVEDLLEYYLQKASTVQAEAERLLQGARDLEESIGVSLSARRFEVNRLELTLSIGSFAAALGAMIAGIFGMNMRNTLEMSALGFYGVSAGIILLCVYVYFAVLKWTKQRRIL